MLLKQHPPLLDAAAVCQLLGTSKAARATALQHCSGQLEVELKLSGVEHVERFMGWLDKFGCLLSSLEVKELRGNSQELQRCAEAHFTEGLQRYTAEHGPLVLKAFTSPLWGKQAGALLQNLSACSLSQLKLSRILWGDSYGLRNSGLSEFSKLRSLSLTDCIAEDTLYVADVVSTLTALTQLTVTGWLDFEVELKHLLEMQQGLPVSLVNLCLHIYDQGGSPIFDQPPVYMQLQHLSRLTSLDVGDIREGSLLPPQLRSLRCIDCKDMLTLQSCTKLQYLECSDTVATAANLMKLSALTGLSSIGLSYYNGASDVLAHAFRLRPLASALHMLCFSLAEEVEIPGAVLQNIQYLTAVTCLKLEPRMPLPGSPADLAAAIRQLTKLQRLLIFRIPDDGYLFSPVLEPAQMEELSTRQAVCQIARYLNDEQTREEARAALEALRHLRQAMQAQAPVAPMLDVVTAAVDDDQANREELNQFLQQMHDKGLPLPLADIPNTQSLQLLTEAIAGLPSLNDLKLKCNGLYASIVEPLTRVTQLTRLSMSGEGFNNFVLIKLVLSLTNLKRLNFAGSKEVTDTSLVVISKVLPQLTKLTMYRCEKVTNWGIAELTGLRHLKELNACHMQRQVKRTLEVIAAQQ